jgi:hypothetical protein
VQLTKTPKQLRIAYCIFFGAIIAMSGSRFLVNYYWLNRNQKLLKKNSSKQ